MKVAKQSYQGLPVVSASKQASTRQRWLGSLAGWRWFRIVEATVLKTLPSSEKIAVPSVRLRGEVNKGLAQELAEDEFLLLIAILQRQGRVDVMFVKNHDDWMVSRAIPKQRLRLRRVV